MSDQISLAPGRGAGRPFGGATPVLLKIYEILSDGQWHRYDEVFAEASKVIQPGEARRWAEMRRVAGIPMERRRREGVPPRKRQLLDDHDLIRGAKKDMFYERIRNSSHILLSVDKGVRYLKFEEGQGRRAVYRRRTGK